MIIVSNKLIPAYIRRTCLRDSHWECIFVINRDLQSHTWKGIFYLEYSDDPDEEDEVRDVIYEKNLIFQENKDDSLPSAIRRAIDLSNDFAQSLIEVLPDDEILEGDLTIPLNATPGQAMSMFMRSDPFLKKAGEILAEAEKRFQDMESSVERTEATMQ